MGVDVGRARLAVVLIVVADGDRPDNVEVELEAAVALTEVPCRFTDRGKVNNRTDNNNGTQTYHVMAIDKDLRPTTISLQSIYRMNGTVTYSDICHYDTATKTTTIETVTVWPSSSSWTA